MYADEVCNNNRTSLKAQRSLQLVKLEYVFSLFIYLIVFYLFL